ncbi:hypothetical protein MHYP_G00225230 [Metynnis hypsauchen]
MQGEREPETSANRAETHSNRFLVKQAEGGAANESRRKYGRKTPAVGRDVASSRKMSDVDGWHARRPAKHKGFFMWILYETYLKTTVELYYWILTPNQWTYKHVPNSAEHRINLLSRIHILCLDI